jgi:hypothetical protein
MDGINSMNGISSMDGMDGMDGTSSDANIIDAPPAATCD